ncbi:MAG TPA: penicillin-binding protein 2 [Caulobacteraceae bacterium]|jgi:cell division protein FtsI (penicillin-binding protein 3)|nr:penicillin-binding protein 2 [Caulobacteraceae bacterium]
MTVSGAIARPFSPIGRWIMRRLWWVEHAFERSRASEKAVDDTRLRIFFVLALFAAGFVTLALGAGKVALFSPYNHAAEPLTLMPGARAELTDRNGLVLALDMPHYGLYVDGHEMVRKDLVRTALLQALPSIEPAKLDAILSGDKRQFLIGALTADQQAKIHDLGLPGVTFEEESGRDYPLGSLAAHVIGFTSKDGVGLAGAEKAFDKAMRADPATQIPLSIDLRVQGALENELDSAASAYQAHDAVGLVVNVRTGEILGMASYPSYDANKPLLGDQTNHAAATVYEPGSVMKVFTLAMGIDAGAATPDTMFDVRTPLVLPGQTIHDFDHGDASLSLAHVFTHSSNIGAARLGLLAGAPTMIRYWGDFGLLKAAPSELVESVHPLLSKNLMSPNIIATMSFGHSISVTPLQLATGMSAILNGGVYRPLTLRRLASGQAPAAGRRVLQAQTSRTMLDLMRLNVVEGTGTKADALGLRVGGKTGTATKIVGGHYQEGKNVANLASFAAIFPTDGALEADRYLVLIMMDAPKANAADGGVTTGAFTAAPVAGKVIDRIAPFVGVRRVIVTSDLAPKAKPVAALGADER